MNTSKQVNAMIGLLGLLVLVLAAYAINEGNRMEAAREEILERDIVRGSKMFVNNCRSCHGMTGKGSEEGAFAPVLHNDSFLIIDEHNQDFEATPAGDAAKIRTFLRTTIACGRTGSPMPTWAERYGGPLSDTKIDQLVTLLTTPGAWEIYNEISDEHLEEVYPDIHDHAEAFQKDTEATLVKLADVPTLTVTEANCGQYTGTTAAEFRVRDPFVPKGSAPVEGVATSKGKGPVSGPAVKGIAVADFFRANCAVCHGQNRQGGVGPALTPARLTQADEFYANTIANGRPGTAMPAWKTTASLSDEDVQNLVTYIKTVNP
ncbi:MAG: c-type cytochrome [Dehalococcoidia bacterium]|nr:c-type cytochrome [Dehalococcoidia bacterium]